MEEDRSEILLRNLTRFVSHVEEMQKDEDDTGNGFTREYRELREIAATNKQEDRFPAVHGKLPYNIKKNRYKDILPFDDQRVILDEIEGVEGSDYINASFVMSVHDNEAYIASQGPLPHTVDDFWRMIWEQKVKVVLMACKEKEAGKSKCAPYWPRELGDTEEYGKIKVKLLQVHDVGDQSDCVERQMSVTHVDSKEHRVVTQYHYTGWPDHGIPDDIDVILEMIARMRDIRKKDKDFAPVVVHCSAGCGRTGTICAIDYAWEVLQSGKLDDKFSMYDIVLSMREQRQSMIQTPDQYEMAHLCVKRLFEEHIKAIDENIYANFIAPPTQDDEYYNVQMVGEEDTMDGTTSTDPNSYETVGLGSQGGSGHAFKLEGRKPTTNDNATSLLKKDCINTIDIYINPESAELLKPKPSVKKPELKKKPDLSHIGEDLQKSVDSAEGRCSENMAEGYLAKSKGYENVIEKASYENVSDKDTHKDSKGVVKVNLPPNKPRVELPTTPESPQKSSPKTPHKDINTQAPPIPPVHAGPSFVSSTSRHPPTIPPSSSGQGFHTPSSVPPSAPVSTVSAKSGPSFESSTHAKPSMEVVGRKTSLDGNNVTRITVGGSAPRISYIENRTNDNMQKKSPKHHPKFKKTSEVRNSVPETKPTNQNQVVMDTNDVYSLASDPSRSIRSSVGENRPVRVEPENTEGAVYSQVSKVSKPSSHPPAQRSRSDTYESISDFPREPQRASLGRKISSDGLYSEVELSPGSDMPVLPDRGYKQEVKTTENTPPAQHVTTERKQGTAGTISKLQSGIQNMFGRGGSDQDMSVDTSHIPGFRKQIQKKPKGPKDRPHFWNKILK